MFFSFIASECLREQNRVLSVKLDTSWPPYASPNLICILYTFSSVVYVCVLESCFVIRELQHAALLSSLKVESYICIWMSPRPLCLPTRYPPKTLLLTQSSYGKTNFIKFSITHQAEPIFLPMQLTAPTFTIIWLQPLWKKSERVGERILGISKGLIVMVVFSGDLHFLWANKEPLNSP